MKKNSPNQKLTDGENRVEQESNEASLDNLLDDCIFPSPIPISKEEVCVYQLQLFSKMELVKELFYFILLCNKSIDFSICALIKV